MSKPTAAELRRKPCAFCGGNHTGRTCSRPQRYAGKAVPARRCSICGRTGHDKRQDAARRNPATAQLERSFEGAIERIGRAKTPKGERRWERSAKIVGDWLDADAPRQTFYSAGGKPVPLRYPLQAHNRYHDHLDSHGSYQRRLSRQQSRRTPSTTP